ncbi:hypothetical protein CDAR_43931 [Caerostris darwini]|uniref:Uncharacterized protein n=1 Tax=Caerostris darwini TaxID=1538125 RepID=A0AAV4WGR8_9ARAC|nr:hypothetical protein CDAR_43931 [Caerostris darwini]
MIGIISFLVFLWCYVQVFFLEQWWYCIHFLPFIFIAKLLIERSNSGSYSRKFANDVHCQTCLVTGTKDASTSTYDLDSFVNAYGDEEADMLDDAMALQSPNFIPQVNLNPFTNPFYELLSFDDPLDYLLWTELDGESACAEWILKNESFFGE